MFQHFRAVMLAVIALVGLGIIHSVSAASLRSIQPVTAIAVVAPGQQLPSAQVRSLTSASVRAIAIRY
jgi:hypothetical protein